VTGLDGRLTGSDPVNRIWMNFIMLAYRKGHIALVMALSLGFGAYALAADFSLPEVAVKLTGDSLQFTGLFDLGLTPKVEEALSKGIPLELILGVRLYRQRAILWDEKTTEWTRRRQIRYHALSGQYLVSELDDCLGDPGADCAKDFVDPVRSPIRENFNSLTEALRELGSLNDLKLRLPPNLTQEDTYSATLRIYLDIEALPSPLRPVAYTSPDWHLNSGWTSWTVQR
jgi:hypothetical protein